MSSRRALDVSSLRRDLLAPPEGIEGGSLWTSLDLAESVGSSNSVLAERARSGDARSGAVLVAEEQTAGRGRRDRGWTAPRHSSVMLSLLVEPLVEPVRWGWLPLVTALAVTDSLAEVAGVRAAIKWPNDVVVDEAKVAGILSEVVPTAAGTGVVVGIGINVDQDQDELPRADATSVRLARGRVDRHGLAIACLQWWERWYRRWESADGRSDEVSDAYAARSSTLGRGVRVHMPDGTDLTGTALRLDEHGHLVVDVGGDERVVAAADVVHLRPDGLPR